MDLKKMVMCKQCQKIPKNPIRLTCSCVILCNEHVEDLIKANDSFIMCPKCKVMNEIPKERFATDQTAFEIITEQLFLSNEEKNLRLNLKNKILEFNNLLKLEISKFPSKQSFESIKAQISYMGDNDRGKELINQIEECEHSFNNLLYEKIEFDFNKENLLIETFFFRGDLTNQIVENFNKAYSDKIEDLNKKLEQYKMLHNEKNNNFHEPSKQVAITNNYSQSNNFTNPKKRKNLITISFTKNVINILNLENNLLSNNLKLAGHEYGVWCMLKFSTYNKNFLLTGGGDHLIKFWDLDNKTCLREFIGHKDFVYCLKFLKKGKLLVSCSQDKTIKIWNADPKDPKFGECCETIQTVCIIKCLEVLENQNLIGGSRNNKILTYSNDYYLKKTKNRSQFVKDFILINENNHSDALFDTAVVNCIMDLKGSLFASCSDDCTIKIWDYDNKCIHNLTGHSKGIMDLALRTNMLFSCSLDSSIKVWDIESGECVKTIQSGPEPKTIPPICLRFDDDGYLISSHQKFLKIWNWEKGNCKEIIEFLPELKSFEFFTMVKTKMPPIKRIKYS